MITDKEFFDKCASFNFLYVNTDDYFRVFIPHQKVEKELHAEATTDLQKEIFSAWKNYSFS
jgi:hypothetical protein